MAEPRSAADEVSGKRVFVVYGHDESARKDLELTLHRIGAEPMVFDQLKKEGSQTIVEILETNVAAADAIVCILTPDDERRKLGTEDELEPCARQNVLIEAGYALLHKRNRSVLVALGGVSIPSDWDGIHRVEGDSWTPELRRDVAKRLAEMGLDVDVANA